jgi:predicted transcriptional regulator
MTDTDPRAIPTCRADFLRAAVQLRDESNLTPADIAVILRLTPNAVSQLLYEADHGREMFSANTPGFETGNDGIARKGRK